MKLTLDNLENTSVWAKSDIAIPSYDVADMQSGGTAHPRWVHIGPGNIFRAFIARIADDLLAQGQYWPICAVDTMDPEATRVQLLDHDLLSLKVSLLSDGTKDMRVVAGISECLATRRVSDYQRFIKVVANPEMQLISSTITEKGYNLTAGERFQQQVADAITQGPEGHHVNAMAMVTAALYYRFRNGGAPITVVSMDNFSHNGDKFADSVRTIAKQWYEKELVEKEFIAWITDDEHVAFPVSVIDKITPRPSQEVADLLSDVGFTDMDLKRVNGQLLAGFVNTEAPEYLLIEDRFAGEKPPFDQAGVIVTDRKTCLDFERMKVTTCLNPIHTALSLAARLLGIKTIDAAITDPLLERFAHQLTWVEGMPVVVNPEVVTPEAFLKQLFEERFPNRYLPDDPARIAMDTSQKLPIRFGETIREYVANRDDVTSLTAIPLVFALWFRYLMGVDDAGEEMDVAPDPLREEMMAKFAHVHVGEELADKEFLYGLLRNESIFGLNLVEVGLADRVVEYFESMLIGLGAVRATIEKVVK